jgi:hypothetical protein
LAAAVVNVRVPDIVPKTWERRLIGAALMVIGLGSVGVLAGSVGAIFSAPREDDSARLERIESELRALHADLDRERRL